MDDELCILTYILHFLHDIPFACDCVGQWEGIILESGEQRCGHTHLIVKAQILPWQMLTLVQQIAAGFHDAQQQLVDDGLALPLIGECFHVACHFFGHRLDDFRGDQHVAAEKSFAACHLEKSDGERERKKVVVTMSHW